MVTRPVRPVSADGAVTALSLAGASTIAADPLIVATGCEAPVVLGVHARAMAATAWPRVRFGVLQSARGPVHPSHRRALLAKVRGEFLAAKEVPVRVGGGLEQPGRDRRNPVILLGCAQPSDG